MKAFTKSELKQFDGKDNKPILIGYKGYVYDVSESFLWKNGKHQALHSAGLDLTEDLKSAPHGEEFIKKFPVVGYLKEDKNSE